MGNREYGPFNHMQYSSVVVGTVELNIELSNSSELRGSFRCPILRVQAVAFSS